MKCDSAWENIASILDDLVPNRAWIARPNLAIISTQMQIPIINSFLESNSKAPSSMCERMSAAIVENSKSRVFCGC